jgi:Beta-ketoacyl synthase, N-terminal domain
MGTNLTWDRDAERACIFQNDKRSDLVQHFSEAKQEPIAIVGMAVNMPGAPDIGQLWEILASGSNTVEEVRI